MATPPEAVDARRGLTGAQIALVVLGVIAILVALWFFVLNGGGAEDEAAAPPAPAAPEPEPEPEPEPSEAPTEPKKNGPVETFEVFAPKDPFKPLVAETTATSGGTTAEDTGGGGETGGTTAGDAGTGTSGGTGTTGDDGGGTRTASGSGVGGHTVRLVDAFGTGGRTRAQVEVDGKVYTVDEGETFADNFQLVSVQDGCASLLFGDDQFTLCEGEEILK